MKGYTDFYDVNRPAAASGMKFLDWEKAEKLCKENPTATIMAGLREDWNNTSEIIWQNGKWINEDNVSWNGSLYALSRWATPIIDVDGKEIECFMGEDDCPTENQLASRPSWWGHGEAIALEEDEDE